MLGAVLLLLPAPIGALPLRITLDLTPGPSLHVIFEGEASVEGRGDFRGSLELNGSPVGVPLAGRADAGGGRARVEASLSYADVPEDWMARSRPETFDYRLRGEIPGTGTIAWSGTLRWKDLVVAGGEDAAAAFLKLGSFELTALSERRTEGRAVLNAVNPFAFPVSVEARGYRAAVNGVDVGAGSSRGRNLRPLKKGAVELPFSAARARFLTAAGGRWEVGADVDAALSGLLTLRLVSALLEVPFRFPGRMGTDGARSGVFSHPDGVSSLSRDP